MYCCLWSFMYEGRKVNENNLRCFFEWFYGWAGSESPCPRQPPGSSTGIGKKSQARQVSRKKVTKSAHSPGKLRWHEKKHYLKTRTLYQIMSTIEISQLWPNRPPGVDLDLLTSQHEAPAPGGRLALITFWLNMEELCVGQMLKDTQFCPKALGFSSSLSLHDGQVLCATSKN